MVQAQRRRDRLEQAADRIAATLRGTLAETGERLSAWLTTPPPAGTPEDGILLIGEESAVTAYPPGHLLFYPAPASDPEAPAALFAEGESLEFLQAQPGRAAGGSIGAWRVRRPGREGRRAPAPARVLAKLGQREEARGLRAYGGHRRRTCRRIARGPGGAPRPLRPIAAWDLLRGRGASRGQLGILLRVRSRETGWRWPGRRRRRGT
jgi:hypothetical protein